MNRLYHILTNDMNDKDQFNGAIEYEPKFDDKIILSSGTKEPLSVVTFILRGGKKHRATIITSLTCLWIEELPTA